MAAEVIAGGGIDMFRVDLSQVISRWVGETEKNLKQISMPQRGRAVILFDEADAPLALVGTSSRPKTASPTKR